MAPKQICARCGKPLRAGTGPDMPVQFAMTGETICGDCMMKMLEAVSPPVDENYEVQEFSKRARDELAQLASVAVSSIVTHCKQFISHDIEIDIEDNVYKIVFIYDLVEDRIRWNQARDYLVSWIKQHPLSRKTWPPQFSTNRNLDPNGRFVFIFLPEQYPEPPRNFGAGVAEELCRSTKATTLAWMVCPISTASQESGKRDMAHAITAWSGTQNHPETLRFHVKTVKFHFSPDECTCMIVSR